MRIRVALASLALSAIALAQAPPLPPRKGAPAPVPTAKPAVPPSPAPAPTPAPAPGATGPQAPSEAAVQKSEDQCLAKKFPPGKKFKWSLRNEVDLETLVQWASTFLCHPVIVPQNLRQQKVHIYAPEEISVEEARRMFYATLNSMGLTVQPQGLRGREVYTVIESNQSHERAVPFIGPDGTPPSSDQFVTKMVRLKNVSPEEMLAVLQKLKSKDGDIASFGPTQTLLITDAAENIRRMDEVIKLLDQAPLGGDKVWTIKLHNVAASEMAGILEKIFLPKQQGGAPAAGGRPHVNLANPSAGPSVTGGPSETANVGLTVTAIIPEDRSNTLIIVANERTYQYALAVIHRLDQSGGPIDSAADRVHVYQLANANAEDLAGTLSGLGIGVARGRTGTTSTSGGARPASAAPIGGSTSSTGQSTLFEGEVKVAPDKPTNSLVIIASGRDYLTLRDLIRRLDLTRRQVFLEATILEVSLDKARKLGLAWHGGDTVGSGSNQSLLFGGSEPNSSVNSILFSPAALSGLAAGLRGPNIPGAAQILGLPPGTSIPAFGVFVQAIQNNNDVNVVSMPHILTTDNEKATIQVGQNLPFPGMLGGFPGFGGGLPGSTGTTGGGTGFGIPGFGTSVQRQDVAIKVEVTPHVNESDFVRLEVDAEVSDVSSPNYNGLGPATDKRTVKSVVVVRDQQPIVLGGLIKDKVAETVDKVPLLGDIPIIGYLFKYTSRTVQKQNLLIILTPYVIKDPSDLRRIFERKIQERKEFLERYSAFQDRNNYDAAIDYRRKRGLLEEINRTAVDAEIEATEIRAAEAAMQGRTWEGPIEPISSRPPQPPSRRLPPGVSPVPSGGGVSGAVPPQPSPPPPPPTPPPPETEQE